ncbi:MAG: COX aromatic rich motif-containing protein [Candidatus Levyibacteriota bacterium]
MKIKLTIFILCLLDAALVITLLIGNGTVALLTPEGIIARSEKNLLITMVLIMLSCAIPVFLLAFFIAVKYKEGSRGTYAPDWKLTRNAAVLKWIIPITVILFMAFLNWKFTHELDPYKKLAGSTPPVTIQVVALRWKWLFIYPDQKIATVNFIEIPLDTPITFELTSDGPMNSFWIPQLGGQMYAMTGMKTQIHLEANTPGEYRGSAAEINGAGFSGMKFRVKAVTPQEFNTWVGSVRSYPQVLNGTSYQELLKPSENNPPAFYSNVDPNLYNEVLMKYMLPSVQKVH